MKGKVRLGKGLNALIPSAETPGTAGAVDGPIQELDVNLIEPNPFQPRLNWDADSLDDLKKSIEEKGVIQPILVRPLDDGRFQLVAGERRLRASLELGIPRIPAFIKNITSDEDMLEIALIENVQREHLNPIDLALGYQRLIDECQLTQEEVAKKIGKDRTTITNVIRLLKLPRKIQESLARAEIREGHARALLRVSDPKAQEKVWKRAVKDGLSVRSVEQLARKAEEQGKSQPAVLQRRKPAYLTKMENTLREKLGTQVKIHTRKDGGGIEISFYSQEDLERLMDIFNRITY